MAKKQTKSAPKSAENAPKEPVKQPKKDCYYTFGNHSKKYTADELAYKGLDKDLAQEICE